jgi:hypothetical protein
MIYALVDATGNVYVEHGATSYVEVAEKHGLGDQACDRYRFDLVQRRLVQDRGGFHSRRAARAYFVRHVGSPQKLMLLAREGRVPKHALATLLVVRDRPTYLEACAAVERRCTEACAAAGDPCLPSGCAMEGQEICLQPLVRAGVEYQQACGAEWVKWFASPRHRIDAWQD